MNHKADLPSGWSPARLSEVAHINPKEMKRTPPDNQRVSFIPMSALEPITGRIDVSQLRPWGEVKKGYTRFREGDVLFAKITPCMENGKIAVARNLAGEVGVGSTEFHVIRPGPAVVADFLRYFLVREQFRKDAKARMTGTAGQLRVPTTFLEQAIVPLGPVAEQQRLVEALESYFSRLDDAESTLTRVKRNLERYRASVLRAAVEGRLVPSEAELAHAEGREYEPASMLLKRILAERRRHWETSGRKKQCPEPVEVDAVDLPKLPEGWCWATADQVCVAIVDCPHSTPKWTHAGKICVRTTEFRPGHLDLSNVRYVSDSTFEERIARLRPQAGDILYSREGGILGIACQVPSGVELCLGQRMMLMRLPSLKLATYFQYVLNSPLTLSRVKRITGGSASPHVNVGDVRAYLLPLPPEDEAGRITSAVDHLVSLADATERATSEALARCARQRQSILGWAFDGKLADQNPTDEPASMLLARVKAEHEAVETTGKKGGPLRRRARMT